MISEIALRAVLLAGLVAHKALWEFLKRGRRRPRLGSPVAVLKILFLAGIVIQTFLPPILPIREDPGSLRVVGLALFLVGLATAMIARVQLGANWADIERADIQTHQTLVERGIYRYVRHPIYTGDLLLILGLELSLNSWLVLGMLVLIPVVVYLALREEAKLKVALAGYSDYCRRTWRFFPFIV